MRCLIVLFLLCVTNLSYSQVKKRSKPINYGHATYDVLPVSKVKGVKIDWQSNYFMNENKEQNETLIYFAAHGLGCDKLVDSAINEFKKDNRNKYYVNYKYGFMVGQNNVYTYSIQTISYSLIKL